MAEGLHTYVIAEAACTWRYVGTGLELAEQSIKAAKACGADAWKTQWTTDPKAMAKRRGLDTDYSRLAWPQALHKGLKYLCDQAGLDYMCTVYLPQDIEAIMPYVKKFKIAAMESNWPAFVKAHPPDRDTIASVRALEKWPHDERIKFLHCVSLYPTPPELLQLARLGKYEEPYAGLSDHTTGLLAGAVAVARGARIIEKHVRLWNTPTTDVDYGHSLALDKIKQECFYCSGVNWCNDCRTNGLPFAEYVANIREAEKLL